jgi:hypothetical protein
MMKMTLNLFFDILFGLTKTFDIVLENLALRQQLAAMKRSAKRPKLRVRDRLFWVILSRFWSNWQDRRKTRKCHSLASKRFQAVLAI